MEDEIPKPRVATIRKIAFNIIMEMGVTSPPILIKDVIKTLKRDKKVNVDAWDLGNISGLQVFDGEEANIAYNKGDHVHRKRMTVAHEIGHFLLGHTRSGSKIDSYPEIFEREAYLFATELLIPFNFIKADIQKPNCNIKALAKRYWVSENALWVHISRRGLLGKMK